MTPADSRAAGVVPSKPAVEQRWDSEHYRRKAAFVPALGAGVVELLAPGGEPISCLNKIKVLNENFENIRQMAQDVLDDPVPMGYDETQFRRVMRDLADGLDNQHKKQAAS